MFSMSSASVATAQIAVLKSSPDDEGIKIAQ